MRHFIKIHKKALNILCFLSLSASGFPLHGAISTYSSNLELVQAVHVYFSTKLLISDPQSHLDQTAPDDNVSSIAPAQIKQNLPQGIDDWLDAEARPLLEAAFTDLNQAHSAVSECLPDATECETSPKRKIETHAASARTNDAYLAALDIGFDYEEEIQEEEYQFDSNKKDGYFEMEPDEEVEPETEELPAEDVPSAHAHRKNITHFISMNVSQHERLKELELSIAEARDKQKFELDITELPEEAPHTNQILYSIEPEKTPFLPEEQAETLAKVSAELGVALGSDTFQAILDPKHKTLLYAELNSSIRKIYKNIGESFEKGELLVQLGDEVVKGNLKKAEAKLEKAQIELEATQYLFLDELASLFELKEAEAKVAEAYAELTLEQKNLRATQIRAPYNGVVVQLKMEEYEFPQAGKELIEIIEDEILLVKLLIPSRILPKIQIGKPLTVHVSETGEIISANIARIGGMIDPSSSTILIEAEISNAERRLKAGMSGLVKINEN